MVRAPRFQFIFCRRGAAAIEYAIVLPVLLMFVLGIMDTGRLLWTYATIYKATEAAARCAAIAAAVPTAVACTTSAQTQTYAVDAAWGLAIDASTFTVSSPACGIQVHASYDFQFTIPWFPTFGESPPGTTTLTATVCYPFNPPA
ncbi:TadE-like protein [mine drainage metagenome]|uniref:TadE-like protein n=1 Tax=mine drainage metagenome TaxID=410659 RepID=A0A1J5NYP2_9ZZZZ